MFVNGDVGYFDDFSQPLSYARNTIYFVQALLGDAVLVRAHISPVLFAFTLNK